MIQQVLILTEAGKNIGFGHLTRCIALYQAFLEKQIRPLLVVNGDNSIKDFLKGINYRIFNWLEEKGKLDINLNNKNIVIIDSYLADKALYERILKLFPNKLLVAIDDYNRIEYPAKIVINPSIYGEKIKYPNKQGLTYLLGSDFIILRKEFWRVPSKTIRKNVKDILITFGGSDSGDLAEKLIYFLLKQYPNFYFHYVGKKSILKFHTHLKNYTGVSALIMRNLILKSDFCISAGGQTLYELARCGLPVIGVCFAKNQEFNLVGLKKNGFLEYAGGYNDGNLCEKINGGIKKFMPYKERLRRSEIGNNVLDGKGADRIIKALTES